MSLKWFSKSGVENPHFIILLEATHSSDQQSWLERVPMHSNPTPPSGSLWIQPGQVASPLIALACNMQITALTSQGWYEK